MARLSPWLRSGLGGASPPAVDSVPWINLCPIHLVAMAWTWLSQVPPWPGDELRAQMEQKPPILPAEVLMLCETPGNLSQSQGKGGRLDILN